MSGVPYFKLREFLDQFPLGFPQTPAGVEIKILKEAVHGRRGRNHPLEKS
jgi:hypothetical protein